MTTNTSIFGMVDKKWKKSFSVILDFSNIKVRPEIRIVEAINATFKVFQNDTFFMS
ncbi:hypothetical protein FBALC1_00992 [Flavobacteriales bacterium ALC-1]|nr:hypothetical protein FBALC1_00992 [Flavobacteriales bacterium ALC-1]